MVAARALPVPGGTAQNERGQVRQEGHARAVHRRLSRRPITLPVHASPCSFAPPCLLLIRLRVGGASVRSLPRPIRVGGACGPPPPVAAPFASSLRASFRGDP